MHDLRYVDQIRQVMIASGQLVMNKFRGSYDVFEKNGTSLYTSVDVDNERFLQEQLGKIMPQAGFIGEESGVSSGSFEYAWVIDPLDGTKNFIHGIPHFCIIVALTHHDIPVVAAIYQPVTQELYYAEQGKGFWYNGTEKIRFENRILKNSALVVGNDDQVQLIKKNMHTAGIQISKRYGGSIGIDMVYVACGYVDLISADTVYWWDIAAGILCIQESGGLDCSYSIGEKKDHPVSFKAGKPIFFSLV